MPSAWVLVVGMHRSGTSAAAGVLSGLGLSLPSDPMTERKDNDRHNESISLTDANDGILGILGGTWDEPPALGAGWEHHTDLLRIMPMVARVAAAAFPTPGVALWKDPRNCLLLPYWKQILTPIAGIVLPWREPLAVARSLAARDGIPINRGLELWHRYNEAALRNSRPHETLAINYDELVEDAKTVTTAAAAWLEKVIPGLVLDPASVARAQDTVSVGLRHEHCAECDLPSGYGDLRARLAELQGGRRLQASPVGT